MPTELDFVPVISPQAFQYLQVQAGRLSKLIDGPDLWRAAYRQQLLDTLSAINRFIPKPLVSVLDIGGGMGGFDALLNRAHPNLSVAILDGMRSAPNVVERDKPYSNATAAANFLKDNGVSSAAFYDPDDLPDDPPKVDLIVSLQAWCFHFMPSVYMNFAFKCSRPGTVWILDVRIMQRYWASDLFSQERLEPLGEAPGFNDKYTRMAFKVT